MSFLPRLVAQPFNRSAARHRAAGFTLLETVAVIGIMIMLLLVVDRIFLVNEDYMAKTLARIDNDNGAVIAIGRLGELSRGATAILTSETINGTLYTTSPDVLVLQIPTLDGSGNIVANSSDYVAFYRNPIDSTQIYTDTAVAAGSARQSGKKLLTDDNALLTFSYNNPLPSNATRVSVFLVNQQTVRGVTITTKEWTSIFLRNH
jgi:hypothetical protein